MKDPSGVFDPAAELYKVPELAALGRAFRSTPSTALTETEMEYVVGCVKHIFDDHVVLQFGVTNTVEEQILKDVSVHVELSDEENYTIQSVIPAPSVKFQDKTSTYVVLHRHGSVAPVTTSCELHFKVVQIDPQTQQVDGDPDGDEDFFPLEALELYTSDYMSKVSLGDFRRAWEQMGAEGELLEKFALQFKSLDAAVATVIDFLSMQAADGTGTVQLGDKRTHTLHLSGVYLGGVQVLVRAGLQLLENDGGVVLKMNIRSSDPAISQLVSDCIR